MVCKWKQAIWAAIERKLLVGRWPDTVNWRYLRSSSEASGPGTEVQVPPPTLENPSLSSGGFRRLVSVAALGWVLHNTSGLGSIMLCLSLESPKPQRSWV